MTSDRVTILERLRTETRLQHDRLEEVAASDKLAAGSLSDAAYVKLLKANYAAHRRLEKAVAAVAGMEEIVADRQKTALLEKDLEQAGVSPEAVWKQLETQLPSPNPGNSREALGMQYVMEGATLGGVVILKALNQHPHLQQFQPFYYYGCYGGDTGRRWSSFKQLLQHEAQSPEQQDQVVAGAKAAYQLFEKAFLAVQV